jgi:hypothetical protein
MKKFISFCKNEDTQRSFVGLSVLVFTLVAGYYGLEMFIMYHNPMHLVMVGLSLTFSIIVLQHLFITFKLFVYYPVKKRIKNLIAKW